VTNTINGKFYIGKHQTKNIYDQYYGSGKNIKAAIKKYGKESFSKEILFVFDNEKEMNDKERELITEEFVLRIDTYNMGVGGEGGPHFKGKKHSQECLQKRSKRRQYIVSEETKKKISEANIRRFQNEEVRKAYSNKKKGHIVSEETKQKISNSLKGRKRSQETKNKISETMKQCRESVSSPRVS
jgi:hypothetical protein